MGVFLLLAAVTLYLYPSENGFEEVNIAVTVLGYVGFILFLVVIAYHIHHKTRHAKWNVYLTEYFQKKVNKQYKHRNIISLSGSLGNDSTYHSDHRYSEINTIPKSARFQESFLEEM